jgi:prevent-host-death family protein
MSSSDSQEPPVTWTLAQAKNQLSEVVRRARSQGPQTISVRGRDEVVVLAREEYEELSASEKPPSFYEWLKTLDLDGVDLERDRTPPRDINFDE